MVRVGFVLEDFEKEVFAEIFVCGDLRIERDQSEENNSYINRLEV